MPFRRCNVKGYISWKNIANQGDDPLYHRRPTQTIPLDIGSIFITLCRMFLFFFCFLSTQHLCIIDSKLKDVLSQIDFCKSISVCRSNGKMIIGPLFTVAVYLTWSSFFFCFEMNKFKFRYNDFLCVYVVVKVSIAFYITIMIFCGVHLSWSISWNLQLNVRNKSAAAECYIRTEVCLEGSVNFMISIIHLLYISLKCLPFRKFWIEHVGASVVIRCLNLNINEHGFLY